MVWTCDRDVNDRQTDSPATIKSSIAEEHAEADTPGGQAMPTVFAVTNALWVGKNFPKEAVDIGTGYIAAVLLQPLFHLIIIIIGQS